MSAPAGDPPRPRRRLRAFLWALGLVLVARAALALGTVPLLRALAARQGLELELERCDLALLDARVELWRLAASVRGADGVPRPLASFQSVALDLDTLALLRGHVRVRRLELDGGRIELARDAEGEWSIAPLLARLASGAEDVPEEPGDPRPISLAPPLEVIAARAQDLTLHLRDEAADPPLDATLTASLTATDVGSPGRRARIDLVATSPQALDLLRVHGTGTAEAAGAELDLTVELSGLRARPLAALLAELGVEPRPGRVDGGMELRVRARPASEDGMRVAATVELGGASLSHDGREALALDALAIEAPEASADGLRLDAVDAEGLRARVERAADGLLSVAGFAWRGRPPGEPGLDPPLEPAPAAAAPAGARAFAWSCASLCVRGGELVLADAALRPPLETSLRLEELTLGPLSSAADAPPARVALAAAAPHVAAPIALAGEVRPSDGSFDLALDVHGIDLEPLAPYLAAAGLGPALHDGSLRIESLGLTASADTGRVLALRGLALRAGDAELCALGSLAVKLGAAGVEDVTLTGARLDVTRAADGSVSALGLRSMGAAPGAEATRTPSPSHASHAPRTDASFALPALALPAVSLELERLRLVDDAAGAPVVLGPLGVTLAPAQADGPGARAWSLAVDGRVDIARELGASARIEQAPAGDLALAAEAHARGLDLEPLRPWLALAGLEPALADGAFEGAARVTLSARDGRPALDAALGPLRLTEGDAEEERLALASLAVEGLVLGDALALDVLRIQEPRLRVERDAEGGWRALGLRLPPRVMTGADAAPGASPPDAPRAPGEGAPAAAPHIGRLELAGARLELVDGLRGPEATLAVGADLGVGPLAPGPGAPAATIDARIVLGAGELTARGEVTPDPDDLRAQLDLGASGLAGEVLTPWLPPGLEIALADGTASARIEAHVARADAGGRSFALRVTDADLRERDAERPLAALGALRLDAPRLDPAAGVYELAELALEGARLDVVRDAAGGVAALGLRITPVPAPEDAAPAGDTAPAPQQATPARRTAPARLALGALALELAELRIVDETRPGAEAPRAAAQLVLREPFALELAPDGEDDDPPPLRLDAKASVAPGIGALDLGIELAPFAERPRVDAALDVRGIDAAGLVALAPELAAAIDPGELREGTLAASLALELVWRRRHRADFDLRAGVGGELVLSDVALRSKPDAEIALGVDSVVVALRRFVPRSGLLHLGTVEIETPHLRARKVAEGLELAGMVLRSTPADEPPQPSDAASAEPARTPPPPAAAERRVDALVVHGVDVVFEDATADPPVLVPLDELELEVRGLTTRALSEPVPVRFSAQLGASEVSLPERLERRSLLRGMASGGLRALTGGRKEELRLESRPLFQDAALTGSLALVPRPTGWVRMSVSEFELLGLRGAARRSGVEIGEGVLDFSARLRLADDGGHADLVASFSDLSLSEPDGGPISRYLRLPAPLDTVLFALENEQGGHRIPLAFDFDTSSGAPAGTEVALEASKALLGLITEALASAPLRAVGGVTDVVGLGGLVGGAKRPPGAGLSAELPFEPGGVAPMEGTGEGTGDGPGDAEALDEIVEAMQDDELLELVAVHAFGPADLERAERLASPGSSEAASLLGALRRRQAELVRRHDELVSAARAELLLGRDERFAATRAELLACDRDLALTESGVDRVAELLRPGAEERRERRTREAALAIARTRMEVVARLLMERGVPHARIDLRPPRVELAPDEPADARGRVLLTTRGGTPPVGWFRRILGWIGL